MASLAPGPSTTNCEDLQVLPNELEGTESLMVENYWFRALEKANLSSNSCKISLDFLCNERLFSC